CALVDVGLYEQLAPTDEDPGQLAEQGRRQYQAFSMPLLPPRVGEMKICNAHRAFWKAWKDEPNVSAEHPTTIAQAGSFQALVDDGGPLAFDLEADETSLRYCHKPFEGERASARSDLEFYR